jgi:hypothetical protein
MSKLKTNDASHVLLCFFLGDFGGNTRVFVFDGKVTVL